MIRIALKDVVTLLKATFDELYVRMAVYELHIYTTQALKECCYDTEN